VARGLPQAQLPQKILWSKACMRCWVDHWCARSFDGEQGNLPEFGSMSCVGATSLSQLASAWRCWAPATRRWLEWVSTMHGVKLAVA
jgi:hypothetical protein